MQEKKQKLEIQGYRREKEKKSIFKRVFDYIHLRYVLWRVMSKDN